MSKVEAESVGWGELLAPHYIVPLTLVCFGIWLHAADRLIVATLMPSIIADIGGERLLGWTLALYEVGSISAGATSALLIIRFDIRRPMAAAAALFAIGCAMSAVAAEMWLLLAGRLLQGLGGGALLSMAYISVGLFFPRRLAARVIGALSALWGLAAFSGPLIGGLFAEYGNWRGGFWFFGSQAMALAIWIFIAAPRTSGAMSQAANASLPARRLTILTASILLIAYAGIADSPLRITLLTISGLTFLWLFFRLDTQRTSDRLLPRKPLSMDNPVSASLLMVLLFSMATVAIGVYGPLLIVMLHGTSSLIAGYILACAAIGWSLTAIVISGSPERRDTALILAGAAIIMFTIPGFLYSVPNGPIWLIALFSALQGSGFGIAWTFILRRATALAEPGEVERVAAAIPTMQRIGYGVGAAAIGIIANSAGLDAEADHATAIAVSRSIFLAGLPLAGLGLIAAWRFVRSGAPHSSS